MEKFSAYRDPGTGIQPFLSPVPPQGSESALIILRPFLYLFSAVRTVLVVVSAVLYVISVHGACNLLYPIPPLRRTMAFIFTSMLCRLSLFIVGVYWIPVEIVRRKRGRFASKETWSPNPGDLIVSNWISWLEIAWLAFRFNPIFVLAMADPAENVVSHTSSPSRVIPGRRTGTGSAAVTVVGQNRPQTKRSEVRGFVEVSLLRMISSCGRVPPYGIQGDSNPRSIDEIRARAKKSGQAIALFPECTTSNGRGLLRFSNVLKGTSVPVKDYSVFVMCVRINPPTNLSPTLSLPIASSPAMLNPISHVFSISSSILPHSISIRLLAPSDSPSSGTFMLNDVLSGPAKQDDMLMEICSMLISDIGRMKRTGMGWEDKSMFLEFYKGKRSR